MSEIKTELSQMLERGIAAAKAGDREMARDLLMRVVERDERNVKAWLWLSEVVDTPDDREVCLENVLTLEPGHRAAQRGLALLRQENAAPAHSRLHPVTGPSSAPSLAAALWRGFPPPEEQRPESEAGYTPPSIEESYAFSRKASPSLAAALLRPAAPLESEPESAAYEPPVPLPPEAPVVPGWPAVQQDVSTLLSEFDDEYLCPYCAEQTAPEDQVCPACKGNLWQSTPRLKARSGLLWLTVLSLVMAAMWQLYGFITWGFIYIQPLYTQGKLKTIDQFIGLYLGRPTVPPDVAATILERLPPATFWGLMLVIGLQLGTAFLIYLRWRPFYWFAVLLACLNVVYAVTEAVVHSRSEWGWLATLAQAGVPLMFLLLIQQDFMVQRERLLCRPDKGLHSHSGFYMRGREYARKKMWTQAVIHYRRATAEAPRMVAYHLALAAAYVQLKRYERALAALQEAQRIEPENRDVRQLAAEIAQKRAHYTGVTNDG